jgi:hypothetical protein
MAKLLLVQMTITVVLIALSACTTALPPDASCHDQWEAYSNDRMHGAMLGGLLGGSISGNKPNC